MILRLRRWFSRLHSTRTIWSSLVPMPSIAFFSMVTSHSSDASVLAHGTGMYTELAAPGGTVRRQVNTQAEARGWNAGAALTELALARLLAVQDRVVEALPIAVVRPLDAGRQACAHAAGQRGSIAQAREKRVMLARRAMRRRSWRAGRAGECAGCVQQLTAAHGACRPACTPPRTVYAVGCAATSRKERADQSLEWTRELRSKGGATAHTDCTPP